MKRRRRRQRPVRMYYGPPGNEMSVYWSVIADNATRGVLINGGVLHSLKSCRGLTIGCSLSNVAQDKANADAFPHPVLFAAFTKSKVLILTKFPEGKKPGRAVRYAHSYGHIVDKNDEGTIKAMVKENPALMERSFHLRPPSKSTKGKGGGKIHKPGDATRSANTASTVVHRGALARAVKAGLIPDHIAKQLIAVSQPKSGLDAVAKRAVQEMQTK